ncbi:MAG: CDP-glycerol glycerophosphotransferase family protein [Blautia sp.]|nr:CDP-glycerol glycerophosphotransferase family protein [Blautia sp.]
MWSKIRKKLSLGGYYPLYHTLLTRSRISRKTVFLESRRGQGAEGNVFALLKEMQKPEYVGFRLVLAVRRQDKEGLKAKLNHAGIVVDRMVRVGSLSYYRELSRAGYLINDTSFPGRFVKREGQKYLNVWHGTPLKRMGKDNLSERAVMGNILRNLLCADYLVFPNRFMEEMMTKAYSLDKLGGGKVIHAGYPRNDIFLSEEKPGQRKAGLGLEGKFLIAFMPTYRGTAAQVEEEKTLLRREEDFVRMDQALGEDQLLLVKLHPFEGGRLDLDRYRHIRPFPPEEDTYEVLAACDALITDYSSVMFDFSVSGRQVVLYLYDREAYSQERGLYLDPEDLPFPYTNDPVEALGFCLEEGKPLSSAYRDRFLTWEDGKGSENVLSVFLKNEGGTDSGRDCPVEILPLKQDQRDNILIYAGDLALNGITTAFTNLYERLDQEKANYFVSFRSSSLKRNLTDTQLLPSDALLFPLASEMNMDPVTAIAQLLFLLTGYDGSWIRKRLSAIYRREWRKHFAKAPFARILHFNGYEDYMLQLFAHSGLPSCVWAHNDMEKETREKKSPSLPALMLSYEKADHVVCVSRDVADSVKRLYEKTRAGGDQAARNLFLDKIKVIPNIMDAEKVRDRAKEALAFEKTTRSTHSLVRLRQILDTKGYHLIQIGRYSPEKGQDLLIEAFEAFFQKHPDSWLILVGGAGPDYERTVELAGKSSASDHIVLIFSMVNPMPLLKRMDLLILPSRYEGYGLVLLEAAFLGIPCFAANSPGARIVMEKYGGLLTEATPEGLLAGMEAFAEGKLHPMKIDTGSENAASLDAVMALL